ncbi:MAG: hypothetical protein H6Q17_567 [Bacteroidetes bacterium]|nr:hypothetical protein [Bacteroidota bacterium]
MIKCDTRGISRAAIELKNLHRAALPNAVRSTLNDLAFDVKKRSLLEAVKQTQMTIRAPGIWKKYSGVAKATGWEINKMTAEVGMIPLGNASEMVERLKQQDEGGELKHTQVPLSKARISKAHGKRVQKKNYWDKVKICAKVQYGDKKGLIKAVTATGIRSGGGPFATGVIYGKFLYGIIGFTHLGNTKHHEKIKLHLIRLYEVEKGKMRHVKAQHFTEKAANISGKLTGEMFSKNVERQLAKWK